MKVEVSYSFDVLIVRRGKRSPERLPSLGRTDVEIEERELPPVLFAVSSPDDASPRWFRPVHRRPCRIVAFDGVLHAEICRTEDLPWLCSADSAAADPFSWGLVGLYRPCRFGAQDKASARVTETSAAERVGGPLRSFDDTAAGGVERTVFARAAELKVAGGSVFSPCPEPTLSVRVEDGKTVAVEVDGAPGYHASGFEPPGRHVAARGVHFRLDRRQEALAYASELSRELDLPLSDRAVVETVDPSVLAYSGLGDRARRACEWLYGTLRDHAAKLPKPLALAWTQIRDAYRAGGGPSSLCAEAVRAAVEAHADSVGRPGFIPGGAPFAEAMVLAEEVSRSLEQPDADDWVLAAPGVPDADDGRLRAYPVTSRHGLVSTAASLQCEVPIREDGTAWIACANRFEPVALFAFSFGSGTPELLAASGRGGVPPSPASSALAWSLAERQCAALSSEQALTALPLAF